jgi:hypothetical protein
VSRLEKQHVTWMSELRTVSKVELHVRPGVDMTFNKYLKLIRSLPDVNLISSTSIHTRISSPPSSRSSSLGMPVLPRRIFLNPSRSSNLIAKAFLNNNLLRYSIINVLFYSRWSLWTIKGYRLEAQVDSITPDHVIKVYESNKTLGAWILGLRNRLN